jgi:hypothetical protein
MKPTYPLPLVRGSFDIVWCRPTGSFAALHCRLYSDAPPALCFGGDRAIIVRIPIVEHLRGTFVQRRPRPGSDPGVERSSFSRRAGTLLVTGLRLQRRRRVGLKPGVERSSSSGRACTLLVTGLRLQRRRRVGLKPGVERSGTPGQISQTNIKPLVRGGGKLGPTDTVHQTADHAREESP